MAAIGKIQASLAAATQETTFALAQLNWDFSLVKVEAPIEFHQLGAALSTKRRNVAEHGDHHRTARRLGSLFEQILPNTPNLLQAYGLRVSEIAQSQSGAQKGGKSYGPFADYVGIDGTNIWAAATSGSPAMAVHLLACMLARIWKASEAIGVWEQIIAARKQELSTFDESGQIPLQSLVASQLTLSRDQISEWDASARAWLRTADEAKAFSQKQLMLIVENVNIPVNRNMDVYFSVIEAWKTAMVTIDKLVVGMGHSVHEGSVLLGLAAWHLYPDMIVLGSSATEVKQRDPLVKPGGVVTFGLQGMHPEATRGVYWSLPLAYVRYYGDPVQAEGSISSNSSRATMEQLLQVIFGALCTSWGLYGPQVKEAAKLLTAAWTCFLRGLQKFPKTPDTAKITKYYWLGLMAEAANHFLKARGTEQESCSRLIALGQKHCQLLGKPTPYTIPILGLRGDSYVTLIEHPEAKIGFLRTVAARCNTALDTLIIRIQVNAPDGTKSYEYLTALMDTDSGDDWVFKRWAVAGTVDSVKSEWLKQNAERLIELPDEAIENLQDVSWFRWESPPAFFKDPPLVAEETAADDESEVGILSRWNPFASARTTAQPLSRVVITFEPFYGDAQTAAIFRRVDRPTIELHENMVTLEEVSAAFHGNRISPRRLVKHLAQTQPPVTPDPVTHENYDPEFVALSCLKSIEAACMVYQRLPSATIDLQVIVQETLANTFWSLHSGSTPLQYEEPNSPTAVLQSLLPPSLNRPATFSCIAFFESGGFNIDPNYLSSVMAVSAGNSIFVAAPLLCDPSLEPEPHHVQRIIGNVGRSGIAFLYPPESPKIKEWDMGFYQVVRHEEFDGKLDDNFRSTTLHLAFSGYELPIDVGIHGSRFIEASLLEAVVSVHDRGEWVADLDVLSTFDSPLFYSLVDQPTCRERAPVLNPDFSVVTIDSWKELIDRPTQVAVLRAHGNWLARLAAASLSVRLGIPTVVFSESCCWFCGQKLLKQIQANAAHDAGDVYHRPSSVIFVL